MSKYIPGNQKHLSLEDRKYIERSLNSGTSFKDIAHAVERFKTWGPAVRLPGRYRSLRYTKCLGESGLCHTVFFA